MPSLDIYKQMHEKASSPITIGQQIKQMSDMAMDETWTNDIATRLCYIYDYEHDDQSDKRTGYDPSVSKTKIPVNLKFIIKAYKSSSKDEPEYHIQFKPNEWNSQSVVPEWFKKYSKLDIEFPIGLYVDIPDDRGVYWKWLIFYTEVANQFPKFGVMKCNYYFMWITKESRIKRHIWGVQRNQNSYNSGIYTYDKTTKMENQTIGWLPYNEISNELFYNQRMIVSMPLKQPITWQVSKIENTKPKGICQFTLYQNEFNPVKDYVSDDFTEMYADYFIDPLATDEPDSSKDENRKILISTATTQLKVHGGYKTLEAKCIDSNDNDVTNQYSGFNWSFTIDGEDAIKNGLIEATSTTDEKIKIRFAEFDDNEDYIGSIISVKCTADTISGSLTLYVVSL